jgi:hypothetical protein
MCWEKHERDRRYYWTKSELEKPVYIFDLYGSQRDTWHDRGLKKYGPYDSTRFTPKVPIVVVICQSKNRGTVSEFLGKFKNGLPQVKDKRGYPIYGEGFVSKYKLSDLNFKIFEADTESAKDYENAVRQSFESGENYNLAIVETNEAFKQLSTKENPYYICKAKFMNNKIPVQDIRIETILKDNSQLAYVLNNISLACYAKIGGIPWVMPIVQNVDHELVIGIGSSMSKEGNLNGRKRVVGITTIFSGDGNYLLNNKSKTVNFEDYFDELLRSIENSIDEVRSKYNWQPGDTVRLVFHTFKPLKNIEIEVIKKLVAKMNHDLNIKFAFLHISDKHPFMLFDPQQNGFYDPYTKKNKGIWQPIRGSNLQVDAYNYIIQLVGPREIKTANQGMKEPLLIHLHRDSTFVDLNYLTQQVYMFAHLSWRSFFPSSMPITILYSELIAQLLGNLREISNWDADVYCDSVAIYGIAVGIKHINSECLKTWLTELLSCYNYFGWRRCFKNFIISFIDGKNFLVFDDPKAEEERNITIWASFYLNKANDTQNLQFDFIKKFWTDKLPFSDDYFINIITLDVFNKISERKFQYEYDELLIVKQKYDLCKKRIKDISIWSSHLITAVAIFCLLLLVGILLVKSIKDRIFFDKYKIFLTFIGGGGIFSIIGIIGLYKKIQAKLSNFIEIIEKKFLGL